VPPIYLSTNYTWQGFGQKTGQYDYSRSGNPTRQVVAETIAQLEGGAVGIITATGLAAVATVCQLLKPQARVLASHDCYGGTQRLFNALAKKQQIRVEYINTTDLSAVDKACQQPVDLLWLETPSNPLLGISDIAACARLAHKAGGQVAVDNTFLSPLWQTPLALGADIVIHSTTKYLNGHSDVVGGALVAKQQELGEQLAWWANCLGVTGSAFDSFLTLRGLRSLHARLHQHEQNAMAVVAVLRSHAKVRAVYYPGLANHPGHAVAKQQQKSFGAMLSFALHGGRASALAFCQRLNWFSLAESLGGVESLVSHPASMTHASMTPEQQRAAGFGDDLLRMSVGIESTSDLCEDVQQALDAL
jgi:cystathionine gamma-synthase